MTKVIDEIFEEFDKKFSELHIKVINSHNQMERDLLLNNEIRQLIAVVIIKILEENRVKTFKHLPIILDKRITDDYMYLTNNPDLIVDVLNHSIDDLIYAVREKVK